MNTTTHSISKSDDSRRTRNVRLLRRSALAVAVALAVAGVAAIAKPGPTLPETSPLALEQSTVQAPASFATLVERVQPAVVNVSVTAKSTGASSPSLPDLQFPDNPQFKDFFERFFQHSPSLQQRQDTRSAVKSVGSGFIVTADGYVVTSNHVVEDATRIQVVLNDGKRLSAAVQGRDPKTDLALLKVEVDGELPYVAFGDSDSARPGDWVVAIGNPFGLGGTATTGIISARGRDIHSGPYDDYLQIDAPINRGNSGGPLFDTSGKVIGVNTAIYSPNGGNVGIGFAVPAAQAKSVIQQLITRGEVERGWLGIQIQTVTDGLAESLKLPHTRGALVAGVEENSPAALAGIQAGDVILAFNEQEVTEMKDLPIIVANTPPGKKAQVTLWRQGAETKLEASISRSKESVADATSTAKPQTAEGARLGVVLAPLNDELRRQYDVPADVEGALVVQIEPGSAADQKGIQAGDVIVEAAGNLVSAPGDVVGVVRASGAGDRVLLLVNRQGNQRFVSVEVG